jgi:hypothetical protein
MNINVYLPDDLGKRAKEADLPFSQLLRDAVATELKRREAMSETLTETETFELPLEDKDGKPYRGRITGKRIGDDGLSRTVYLTEDERVIVYDQGSLEYSIIDDSEQELAGWPDAQRALGIPPLIDI